MSVKSRGEDNNYYNNNNVATDDAVHKELKSSRRRRLLVPEHGTTEKTCEDSEEKFCSYCNKSGHWLEECFHKNPHLRRRNGGGRKNDDDNVECEDDDDEDELYCNFCKRHGHTYDECRHQRRHQEQKQSRKHHVVLVVELPCSYCNKTGHSSEDCWFRDDDGDPAEKTSKSRFCTHCQKSGHNLEQCWVHKREQREAAANEKSRGHSGLGMDECSQYKCQSIVITPTPSTQSKPFSKGDGDDEKEKGCTYCTYCKRMGHKLNNCRKFARLRQSQIHMNDDEVQQRMHNNDHNSTDRYDSKNTTTKTTHAYCLYCETKYHTLENCRTFARWKNSVVANHCCVVCFKKGHTGPECRLLFLKSNGMCRYCQENGRFEEHRLSVCEYRQAEIRNRKREILEQQERLRSSFVGNENNTKTTRKEQAGEPSKEDVVVKQEALAESPSSSNATAATTQFQTNESVSEIEAVRPYSNGAAEDTDGVQYKEEETSQELHEVDRDVDRGGKCQRQGDQFRSSFETQPDDREYQEHEFRQDLMSPKERPSIKRDDSHSRCPEAMGSCQRRASSERASRKGRRYSDDNLRDGAFRANLMEARNSGEDGSFREWSLIKTRNLVCQDEGVRREYSESLKTRRSYRQEQTPSYRRHSDDCGHAYVKYSGDSERFHGRNRSRGARYAYFENGHGDSKRALYGAEWSSDTRRKRDYNCDIEKKRTKRRKLARDSDAYHHRSLSLGRCEDGGRRQEPDTCLRYQSYQEEQSEKRVGGYQKSFQDEDEISRSKAQSKIGHRFCHTHEGPHTTKYGSGRCRGPEKATKHARVIPDRRQNDLSALRKRALRARNDLSKAWIFAKTAEEFLLLTIKNCPSSLDWLSTPRLAALRTPKELLEACHEMENQHLELQETLDDLYRESHPELPSAVELCIAIKAKAKKIRMMQSELKVDKPQDVEEAPRFESGLLLCDYIKKLTECHNRMKHQYDSLRPPFLHALCTSNHDSFLETYQELCQLQCQSGVGFECRYGIGDLPPFVPRTANSAELEQLSKRLQTLVKEVTRVVDEAKVKLESYRSASNKVRNNGCFEVGKPTESPKATACDAKLRASVDTMSRDVAGSISNVSLTVDRMEDGALTGRLTRDSRERVDYELSTVVSPAAVASQPQVVSATESSWEGQETAVTDDTEGKQNSPHDEDSDESDEEFTIEI